jgi:hypothetical protein
MGEFSLDASSDFSDAEVIALYESVGWSAYMLEAIQSRYSHVRQTVPITDTNPGSGLSMRRPWDSPKAWTSALNR